MKKLILGVEIGGTKLQLAAGNLEGELLKSQQSSVNREAGGEGIRQWLLEQVPKFINEVESRGEGQIIAIGCGFGGPIDSGEGRVLESVQIPGWEKFPLKEWFEENFSKPSFVANDSNAAAWGEYQNGFGRGCKHFFYTNLGSGVGGGFVLNKALFDGQGFGAGEFGHTYVPDWTSVEPGRGIEIENLCSGWAIESRLNQADAIPPTSKLFKMRSIKQSNLTAKDLGEAARIGDAFAVQEIDRIARSIGFGLANVLSLTGVERIAIGGGVSKLGEILIEPIRQYTKHFEFVSSSGRYRIGRCELGDDIVLVGAVLLAQKALNLS
jgi:glucokinase